MCFFSVRFTANLRSASVYGFTTSYGSSSTGYCSLSPICVILSTSKNPKPNTRSCLRLSEMISWRLGVRGQKRDSPITALTPSHSHCHNTVSRTNTEHLSRTCYLTLSGYTAVTQATAKLDSIAIHQKLRTIFRPLCL